MALVDNIAFACHNTPTTVRPIEYAASFDGTAFVVSSTKEWNMDTDSAAQALIFAFFKPFFAKGSSEKMPSGLFFVRNRIGPTKFSIDLGPGRKFVSLAKIFVSANLLLLLPMQIPFPPYKHAQLPSSSGVLVR